MEFSQFAKIIGAICVTFGEEASEDLVEAYWIALGDLSLTEFSKQAKLAMQTCERMPRPWQLRSRGMDYRRQWIAKAKIGDRMLTCTDGKRYQELADMKANIGRYSTDDYDTKPKSLAAKPTLRRLPK